MDAGIVEEDPHGDGRDEIEPGPFFADLVHQHDQEDQREGDAQEREVDVAAVEQGDHQDGDEVIRDGQGSQENLQGNGNLVAQDGQDTDRKGDIGGRRDTPAGGSGGAVVDQRIDQGRHDHAAEGRDDRHDGFLPGAEFAELDFPFDFQADGEEEDDHQDVVDEFLHGHVGGEGESAAVRGRYMDGQARFQEFLVEFARKRQVGQKHGDHDAGEQDDALGPGLFAESFVPVLEVDIVPVPGIDGYQFHDRFRFILRTDSGAAPGSAGRSGCPSLRVCGGRLPRRSPAGHCAACL